MNSLSDAYASMYVEEKKPLTAQERANKDKWTNWITDPFTDDSPERRALRRARVKGDQAGIDKGTQKERERVARLKKEKEQQRATAEKTRDNFSANAGETPQDKNRRAQEARARQDKANEYYRNNFAATEGSKNKDPKKNINPRTGKPYSETPGKSRTEAGATTVPSSTKTETPKTDPPKTTSTTSSSSTSSTASPKPATPKPAIPKPSVKPVASAAGAAANAAVKTQANKNFASGQLGRSSSNASSPLTKSVSKAPIKSSRLSSALSGVKKFKAENYDAIVRYMIGEGYAPNEEAAVAIVEHMSDAWVADLME